MERVAVVGIGRIGLGLALNLEQSGCEVLGLDKSAGRVGAVRDRSLRSPEPGVEEALRDARNLTVASEIRAVSGFAPELIFVAVDTPSGESGAYDHGRVDSVLKELLAQGDARSRTEIVIVCTTMPGYCDSIADPAGHRGYMLSYNPLFVAQGSILRDQRMPDQVLIGEADAVAGEKLEAVHRRISLNDPEFHRMSRLSAEIAKLATNCFLTNKIAFANSVGDLATRVGADPRQILDAVGADKRIGRECLRYGLSYGGPCFPRDNRALSYFAKRSGLELLQAEATDEMNRRHLDFQVDHYLGAYSTEEVIDFHSITFKPGTDILEESPALALAERLARAGRTVVLHESPEVLARVKDRFGDLFEYRSASDRSAERALGASFQRL